MPLLRHEPIELVSKPRIRRRIVGRQHPAQKRVQAFYAIPRDPHVPKLTVNQQPPAELKGHAVCAEMVHDPTLWGPRPFFLQAIQDAFGNLDE
jgi:hypothetical protein